MASRNSNQQSFQNQGSQQSQNLAQQQQQSKSNLETASELLQSPGEISRILTSQNLVGLEIGKIGQNDYNQNVQGQNNPSSNQQLEIEQSSGQISQQLSQQSRN